MIELAVLDIAGTTVDEGGAVYRVLGAVAAAHGARDPDVRPWMGADKREALAALLGVGRDDPRAAAAHASFVTELVAAYAAAPPKPLPGVPEALAALRAAGVRVALTTGFDRQVTEPLLAAVGWDVPGALDAVVCADEVDTGRPAPDMIRAAMERLAVTDPARVLVAGDTVLDVRAGRAAGAGMVIGVLTGAQGAADLRAAAPTQLLDRVAGLPELLNLAPTPN
jgi:phosphonatase-like hydrolase